MAQILALATITPASGTPAPISTAPLLCDSFAIEADPANTGKILVKDISSPTAFTIASLAAGAYYLSPGNGPYNLNSIQLDASASSQNALVSYVPLTGKGL